LIAAVSLHSRRSSITGIGAFFLPPFYPLHRNMAHKASSGFNVAIVGAGFGGLAVAIALKTKWGFDNFVIYERGADVGGTWRVSQCCASQ